MLRILFVLCLIVTLVSRALFVLHLILFARFTSASRAIFVSFECFVSVACSVCIVFDCYVGSARFQYHPWLCSTLYDLCWHINVAHFLNHV